MYEWEKRNLVNRVAEREKGSNKPLPILAREAVRGTGITHEPDVRRLANEICAELGKRGRTVQATVRGEKSFRAKVAP